MTHAAAPPIDPLDLHPLALCGLRMDRVQVDNKTPTCPWCQQKLKDRQS